MFANRRRLVYAAHETNRQSQLEFLDVNWWRRGIHYFAVKQGGFVLCAIVAQRPCQLIFDLIDLSIFIWLILPSNIFIYFQCLESPRKANVRK